MWGAIASGLLATAIFSGNSTLHGPYLYDDAGTVSRNPTMKSEESHWKLWTHDYWGEELAAVTSHKSWRPITSYTFRWNYMYAEASAGHSITSSGAPDMSTWIFHATNVILHAIVTALVVPFVRHVLFAPVPSNEPPQPPSPVPVDNMIDLASGHGEMNLEDEPGVKVGAGGDQFGNTGGEAAAGDVEEDQGEDEGVLEDVVLVGKMVADATLADLAKDAEGCQAAPWVPEVVAALFASHAVHTEAVSNITGRGEILAALFYLAGFLCYSNIATVRRGTHVAALEVVRQVFWVCMTLFCTTCSLLSKEQGVTLPLACCVWDLWIACGLSVPQLIGIAKTPRHLKRRLREFCWRAAGLCIGLSAIACWRWRWAGGVKPHFIYDQNPAALHKDALTRFLSCGWVHVLYLQTLFWPPTPLSCDWSGDSILLVHTFEDSRAWIVMAVYGVFITVLMWTRWWDRWPSETQRRMLFVISMFVIPFLLSSNFLIPVGTMKAERVMYLPSLSHSLLVGLLFHVATRPSTGSTIKPSRAVVEDKPKSANTNYITLMAWSAVVVLFASQTQKCIARNHEWSSGWHLWHSAYMVNPRSAHTWHNYGLELSWAGMQHEAAHVFEKSIQRNPTDLSTYFALGVVLRNVGKCPLAQQYMKMGLKLADKLDAENLAERNPSTRQRTTERGYMLGILALCERDVRHTLSMLREALLVDPTNTYVAEETKKVLDVLEKRGIHLQELMQG